MAPISIKDKIRGASTQVISERAGQITARQAQRQIDAARAPKPTPVMDPIAIRSTQSSGDVTRDLMDSLDARGVINDQSSAGNEPPPSAFAANLTTPDNHTIHDGDTVRWRGADWAPETSVSTIVKAFKQDASDTPTTTASSTYQQMIDGTIDLPGGNWEITADGGVKATRNGDVNIRLGIDGVNDASPSTESVDTTIFTEVRTNFQRTGVRGGRTVTVTLNAKGVSGSGITLATKSPRLTITATRL